jgi:hypothetical protein
MTDALLSLNPSPSPNPNRSPDPIRNPSPNQAPHESAPSTEQLDMQRERFAENVSEALGGLGGDPEPAARPKPSPGVDGRIEFQMFKNLFCMPFQGVRGAVLRKTNVNLQTLNLRADTPGIDEPAKALFDLMCAVPWFDKLTKLDNPYLAPGMVLGMFVWNISAAASSEFQAAKNAPTIDQTATQAA